MKTPETDDFIMHKTALMPDGAVATKMRQLEIERNEARKERDELMQLLIDATTEYDSEGYISTETLIASDKLISNIKSTK